MNSQYEREEQALEDDYAAGRITLEEFNKNLRDMNRDYRGEAEAAAQQAYEQELGNW